MSIDKKSSRSFNGDLLLSTEMILDPGIVDRGEVLVARDPPAREHQQATLRSAAPAAGNPAAAAPAATDSSSAGSGWT